MLVGDERLADKWSKPYVIGVVQFLINSQISGETGVTPYRYLFGSIDESWLKIPNLNTSKRSSNSFLQELDSNIRIIREAAYGVLGKIQSKREKEALNTYEIGDFLLVLLRFICIETVAQFLSMYRNCDSFEL
jgi:hypothetical protein